MRLHTIGLMCGLLASAAVAGCVIPLPVGDGRDDEGDEDSEGSSGTRGAATDTSGSDDDGMPTTGSPGLCETLPGFECSGPVDCDVRPCGGPLDQYDANGCLRPPCEGPDDCGAGEACFFPVELGGCASSQPICFEEDGVCGCGGSQDCGGGYCLPEDEVPEASCFGLPDEGACLDAGCSYFDTVTVITDTCECNPGQPACLSFTGGIGGSASPDFFWHEATMTVAMFSESWIELPVGWRSCTEAGAPPACECYEPFMELMCP